MSENTRTAFKRISGPLAAGVLTASLAVSGAAVAEVDELRISEQFGVGYLPLMVMRSEGLIQKHADEAGLGEIEITWRQFGGGSSTNTALIAGQLDFAAGGVGPMLKIWDATRDSMDVRGVASINSMPLFLNTRDEDIQSLEDFNDSDRIALPAVGVSIQAIILQMAAAEAFGFEEYDKLRPFTVSAKHPDGMVQLLSGQGEINAHLTSPPFQYQELESDRVDVHTVFSSYDVLGGQHTFNNIWTTAEFRDENPKTYKAFYDALNEAMAFIEENPDESARIYLEEAQSSLDEGFIRDLITDEDIEFTVTPKQIEKFAEFMYRTEALENELGSWQDAFFPEVHEKDGS